MNVSLVSKTEINTDYFKPIAKKFDLDINEITPEQLIIYIARVSSSRENKLDEHEKLINYLINHKHWSPFEHAYMTVEIETSRAISHQLIRHRSFTFQEFCVSEGTEISCVIPSGKISRRTIEELYKLQKDPRWSRLIRVYDREKKEFVSAKVKEVFKTGKKNVLSLKVSDGKTIKATKDHKFLTRDGFKKLEELSEGDVIAANGEPVYRDKEKTVKWVVIENIEEVGIKTTYDLEVDHVDHNYVANGLITHNSQRYSKATEFENIELREQPENNRQSSGKRLTDIIRHFVRFGDEEKEWRVQRGDDFDVNQASIYAMDSLAHIGEAYKELLDVGVARETARMILPLCTQTKLYMTGNIRSWIHFLNIRDDKHAQKEIVEVAQEIGKIFQQQYPVISKALDFNYG